MEKSLFDYIITPTKEQLKENNIIDDIVGISRLTMDYIVKDIKSLKLKELLINNAVDNYNEEIAVAKLFYVYSTTYKEHFLNYQNIEYEFWCKKYIEQTIKELYSIYDKSIHIINAMYNFQIKPSPQFNQIVLEHLKLDDNIMYIKFNNIYKKEKNKVRNDITHNISAFFSKYESIYTNNMRIGWKHKEGFSIEDGLIFIEEMCNALADNKKVITDKLEELYP